MLDVGCLGKGKGKTAGKARYIEEIRRGAFGDIAVNQ